MKGENYTQIEANKTVMQFVTTYRLENLNLYYFSSIDTARWTVYNIWMYLNLAQCTVTYKWPFAVTKGNTFQILILELWKFFL